ncbi:DUF1002 domain-containing protein, partial [Staphylococcus aureus]
EENQNKDGYSDEALNASIADIKQQLADIKKKQDEQITPQQVEDIVNKVLDERGLSKTLTDNQKQMITDNMTNVANSNALTSDPKAFAKNAKDALKGIEKNSGDLLDKAKDLNTEENRNFVQKIWDSILQIIQSIIGFITSLFNRIF